jgi:hypothetical protein
VQPRYPREQLREEPLGIPQERAFALHAPKLLQEDEGDDLRARKPLYRLLSSSAAGVEVAEPLPGGRTSGYAGIGPSEVPFVEGSDGPRCTVNPCNTHLACGSRRTLKKVES